MILVGCAFNELHWFTKDGSNGDFGDTCWYTRTVGINVCYGLAKLESGYGRERGGFVLLIADGENISGGMLIFYMKRTSEEYLEVQ